MTFSIVGRCEETGQLGVAISSSSIAVGARCPWVRGGVGVVSTQNVTLPSLGNYVLDLLENKKLDVTEAINEALKADEWNQYRQLLVIDSQGNTGLFNGDDSLGIHHAVTGKQCVAAGNLLAGKEVIETMVEMFEKTSGVLGDRLIAALQAGQKAGGEAGPVHAAALKIAGDVSWPIVDLRVDWADEAPIEQLDKLWQDYKPQVQDYQDRALNPTAAPSFGVPGDE